LPVIKNIFNRKAIRLNELEDESAFVHNYGDVFTEASVRVFEDDNAPSSTMIPNLQTLILDYSEYNEIFYVLNEEREDQTRSYWLNNDVDEYLIERWQEEEIYDRFEGYAWRRILQSQSGNRPSFKIHAVITFDHHFGPEGEELVSRLPLRQ
jgi:hypothetical protein